ncbi:hypothetical protein GQ600_11922 [Phytophthora cactorum]|nr:hypothetical protein GQ600_11922 [Phytophthora cactorum]
MAEARSFLMNSSPCAPRTLSERADIVYTADFEAAGVKIQEGRAHQLSRAQKAAVIQLAVREAPATGAASDGALAAAKRRKTTGSSGDEEESFAGDPHQLKPQERSIMRNPSKRKANVCTCPALIGMCRKAPDTSRSITKIG